MVAQESLTTLDRIRLTGGLAILEGPLRGSLRLNAEHIGKLLVRQ